MTTLKSVIDSLKGVSGAGDILREYGKLIPQGANYVLEPGDFLHKTKNGRLSLTAPIATDLWYLWCMNNIIPEDDDENVVFVDDNLKFLADKLGGMKPLRGVKNRSEIISVQAPTGWYGETKPAYVNISDYWIQALAFEFGFFGQAIQFESDGPEGMVKGDVCGYLAFPVGQLGVMEVISVFFETETEVDGFSLEKDETPVTFGVGDGSLFPPADDAGQNNSFGLYLIESGYIRNTDDETDRHAELFAADIPEAEYGDIKPKTWMRLWLHKDKLRPVPGEFVGVLLKPVGLPPHIWWFQESSPFVYAGNWWETEWVTSGVVTERTLEEDRDDGKDGDEYKIRVHGYEMTLYTTDFFRYEVDERVAVVKLDNVQDELPEKAYNWKRLTEQWDKERDQTYTDYIIIPISFYEGG